jgi:hypothetical protein
MLVRMPSADAAIHRPTMRLGAATIMFVALVAVLGLTSPALSAPVHGGPGEIAVVAAEPNDDGTAVHLELAITYINDGEAAERATVEVSGATPDGMTAGPVDVTTTDVVGTYVVDVPVPGPGDWTFSVVSTFPPATLDVPVTVGAAATETTATTPATSGTEATATSEATATTEAPAGTTAPGSGGEVAASGAEGGYEFDDGDDGTSAGLWVGIAVAVIAAAGGVLYAIRRRGA